jgi:hypothetical protein
MWESRAIKSGLEQQSMGNTIKSKPVQQGAISGYGQSLTPQNVTRSDQIGLTTMAEAEFGLQIADLERWHRSRSDKAYSGPI